MKKILITFFSIICLCDVSAQSLDDLESNPSFKGIDIGMPITAILGKVKYVNQVDAQTIYTIDDPSYNSVFGIGVDYVNVAVQGGRIYAIIAVKEVLNSSVVFNTSELDAIEAGLTRHYGKPTNFVGDGKHFGVQWISRTKRVDNIMTFFGTGVGYRILFAISENKEDY